MDFRKKIKVVSLGMILTAAFSEQLFAVPAFPGAEGPGAETVGGRGGRVIEVTNLNKSGPGSLREAIEASGRRIVVFKVAGIIDLDNLIYVKNPYLTIAGQTAPEGGITLKGQGIQIRTHDVVMRYIKTRPGINRSTYHTDAIGMQGFDDLYSNIVDHCTMSWANDENVQIWSKSKTLAPHHITYSWNIISEGLEGHSCGLLLGSSTYEDADKIKNISIHHNLFVSNHHRNPMMKIKEVKFINNLVYNWDYYASATTGGVRLDMIANKYKMGPSTSSYRSRELIVKTQAEIADGSTGVDGEPEIYIRGNIGPHQSDENADNWGMTSTYTHRDPLNRKLYERTTPLPKAVFPITIDSVTNAEQKILRESGASKRINEKGEWVANRDSVDTRIINDYKNGTGSIPASPADAGGYPKIHAGTPYRDSDHDGMADVWEDMYGLDKHNANDQAKDKDGDGYTNIEEFINGTNPTDAGEGVNTPPVITLLGSDPLRLNVGDTFTDPGATAKDDTDGDLSSSIQVSDNVDTAVAGTYHVIYTVSDSEGNNVERSRSVIVASEGTSELYTLQSRVSSSSDDAEEEVDGRISLNSSDLELILDHDKQTVGIRFADVAIPQNAIITKAYIQFKVDEDKFVSNTVINIHGEKTDDALTFTKNTHNISSRPQTNAFVSWSPARWDTIGETGADQRTSDLTSVVQEVISQTGWSAGNAMAFIITGEGKRVAESYDGDQAGAPLLYIEYSISPITDTEAPKITILGENPMNLNTGDTFTDSGATVQDNVDGDITASIKTSHNVDTSVAGTYSVTYVVSDTAGNQASESRSVIVSDPSVDTVAPMITILGENPMNLGVGDTFTDPGATAQDNIDGDLTDSIQDSSNINMDIGGTYQITYTVSDSDGNRAEAVRSVVVSDGTSELHTLQSRVSSSTDDAEERADGSMYLNSSDLELILDHDKKQTVGIRFTDVGVPQNATITKAYIQFKVDEDKFVSNTVINIHGEKGDHALPFSTAKYNISSRTRTNAFVSWSPARWDTIGEAGADQRTSDLSSIVQEIISGTGWSEGNAMAFIITGEGKRVAESYNSDQAGAPMLYVEYSY